MNSNEEMDLSSPDVRRRLSQMTRAGYRREEFVTVFQFKLAVADIAWPIWRRFQVPSTYSLWDLFVAVNDVLSWDCEGHAGFTFLNSENASATSVKDRLWEKRVDDFISLAQPAAICSSSQWMMSLDMEALVEARDGQPYPLFIDGSGPTPDGMIGPFYYAEFLEGWRQRGLPLNEDGSPQGIRLFDPAAIFFQDPDDVWIWVFCEFPLLIEMSEKGRHLFPLPYDRHAVMVPARWRDLMKRFELLPAKLLDDPVETHLGMETVDLVLHYKELIYLLAGVRKLKQRTQDSGLKVTLERIDFHLRCLVKDLCPTGEANL